KSTFCVAKDHRAFVSHHIGDLENYETYASFRQGIDHFCRLFDITPEVVAHDLHPEYLSTKHAHDLADLTGVELTGVQHHHAHIASCLADNGEEGRVIGVAFDGLGYGTDGTIWGGEILVADLAGFERVGQLAAVPMPGGAAAIREPWRMAAAYLDSAFDGAVPEKLGVVTRHQARWSNVVSLARSGVSSPLTSSAGRLFDAVASILGLRDRVDFEAQAAMELEALAEPEADRVYAVRLEDQEGRVVVQTPDIVRGVVEDLLAGVGSDRIGSRFHATLADVIVKTCAHVRERSGLDRVALSGGVFQNVRLLRLAVDGLRRAGFQVYTHHQVPPNDGGLALGQAAIAARLREDRSSV
ncbi:MAG: carbamoyltransferase HypF, partial [Actinomycetota bacterium]